MGKKDKKMSYKIHLIVFVIVTVHCISLINLITLITEYEKPLINRQVHPPNLDSLIWWSPVLDGKETTMFS